MTIKEFKQIIPKINQYSYRQIYEIIDSLELFNLPALKMPLDSSNGNGRIIYRGRKSEEFPFSNARELSYPSNPTSFDRASSPCSPMFYGTISMNDKDIPMITTLSEISDLIRNNSFDNSELNLTFGEFEVKRDIIVAPIIFHDEFLRVNKQYVHYVNNIKENVPKDYEIMKFFSYLFSLKSGKFYNNRLTAVFVDYLFSQPKSKSLDAIIYPSVRCDGEGTNIAFHPEAADEVLNLVRVKEYKFKFEGKFVNHILLAESSIINKDRSFELINCHKKKV